MVDAFCKGFDTTYYNQDKAEYQRMRRKLAYQNKKNTTVQDQLKQMMLTQTISKSVLFRSHFTITISESENQYNKNYILEKFLIYFFSP